MNFARISLATICVTLLFTGGDFAQETNRTTATWRIDQLERIGTHATTLIGNPKIIEAPGGKAVLFDGAQDGLLIESNPVAGLKAFTVEAIFRPDVGGNKEQRWLHI